ncbi:MAG: replication-associated recombination protein A [Nitrospirae bacterium]|nr:MAG: replication-associated recombination protein A [Nitrospirota bacterium]
MDLFRDEIKHRPLAWRMMPGSLEEFVGQDELLLPGRPLRRLIEEDRIVSLILYGPPGTGKTALARIIAETTRSHFISLNAVTSGVKDIRDAIRYGRKGRLILFIDEIHRFNRLQQDALLPHVESGEVTLIGASTQNPFFSIVPALSSRSHIFEFKPLGKEAIKTILLRALSSPKGLGEYNIEISHETLQRICALACGDARKALNILELAFLTARKEGTDRIVITDEHIRLSTQGSALYYDEDEHYDVISAFIKSMRGSDPDASVYYLARMIASGEDPLFIARRIVICAAEDVGNADPMALVVATSAMRAVEKIGMPEGRIPLAQATIYVATAPKSNASYLAIERAMESVREGPVLQVPAHLRDSHYSGAKRLGRGEGYKYPHNYEGHFVEQKYLEKEMTFYTPTGEGYEKEITRIMERRRKKD